MDTNSQVLALSVQADIATIARPQNMDLPLAPADRRTFCRKTVEESGHRAFLFRRHLTHATAAGTASEVCCRGNERPSREQRSQGPTPAGRTIRMQLHSVHHPIFWQVGFAEGCAPPSLIPLTCRTLLVQPPPSFARRPRRRDLVSRLKLSCI